MENHSNDFSYSFVSFFRRKVIDYMLDLISSNGVLGAGKNKITQM